VNGARRLVVSGIALTALLALVALASRAHRPGGGSGGGGGHVPELLGEYIGITMLVLVLLVAVVIGWGLAADRRRRVLEGQTNWRRTLGGIAVLGIALVVAIAATDWLHPNNGRRPGITVPTAPLKAGQEKAKQQKKGAVQRVEGSWLTALILASIILGVSIAAGLAARHKLRNGEELETEAALARALDEVLADTLDDLRAERDPRKAVIEVYARMERTFAAYRVPRDPAETPLEYVSRALDSLRVSGTAVRRLTALFERAKFSTHTVDVGMKDEAIETLAAVRAELEVNEAEAAAA
jgi:Domain of unknown function (DUF4129)